MCDRAYTGRLGVEAVHAARSILYELYVESNAPLPAMGMKRWSDKLTRQQRRLRAGAAGQSHLHFHSAADGAPTNAKHVPRGARLPARGGLSYAPEGLLLFR